MMKQKITGIVVAVLMVITMIPSYTFAASMPFTDVPGGEWFYSDVKGAYETGLIDGFEDNTFRPYENMTYAQAVKLAACMNQKYTTGSVTLANGSPNWYDSYAAYAKDQGIIRKNYDWNTPATRAGYVEIFANALPDAALQTKNRIADGSIPDVGINHPQAASIYKLYRAGVLVGTDDRGMFEPDNNIRRSEVSAILTRMMDETSRKELTLEPVTTRKDGERFEAVITIEGMEETVRYEHVRNEIIGFEMDYDYEKFERQREANRERFVSRYDNTKKPENYLEVEYNPQDIDTVSASVIKALSNDYDIIKESIMLDRAGNCILIDASSLKAKNQMPDYLQTVYIIPASDGCLVATAHYSSENAEGFGRRFSSCMNTFSAIVRQVEKRISNEQALFAIEKYCYVQQPDLKDIIKTGKYHVSWGVTSEDDDSEIVVLFRSYTGAQKYFHINPVSGYTYVTELPPVINPVEQRTGESLNVWDYLI